MIANSSKIRFRSEKELSQRKNNFLKIVDILEKKKIIYFLQGGILLGARREKDFIKWDWDIEISLYAEDLLLNFEYLEKKLKSQNFKIINHNKTHFTPKIAFIKKNDDSTFFSLIGWKYDKANKSYTRKNFTIPEKFLKKLTKIKFLKRKFNCPYPIDAYLKHQYGNWKKPLISQDKNEYLNKNYFHNSIVNLSDYKDKIISFLKKIKIY
jgi:phosphorylcholine metabolism protein LicD